ncbi:Serine protease family s33 [Globisporangium polare]
MDERSSTSSSVRSSVPSSWRSVDMPASLRHLDGAFRNSRDQSLAYVALFPSNEDKTTITPLRGVVVYIHSLGLHVRRYFHLYEQLCERGFGVVSYDLLGHGESDSGRHQMRAHAEKFQYFVDDTNEFIAFAKTTIFPQMLAVYKDEDGTKQPISTTNSSDRRSSSSSRIPLIIAGASYGTLITLHTLLSEKHTFDAVVLVSPAISVEWRPLLRIQSLFVHPMSAILPKIRAVPVAKPELICRDPAFLEDYFNDPLTVSDNMTLRMGAQSLKACAALQREKRFSEPQSVFCSLPILFMMGSADKVTSLSLAMQFFDKLENEDKQFKVFDGMFHALFDDPERDEVFDHLLPWLEARGREPVILERLCEEYAHYHDSSIGKLAKRGLLPHLAIAANNLHVLRVLYKLRSSSSTSVQYQRDPKLSFSKAMRCAVVCHDIEALECILELRGSKDRQWEPNLLRIAIQREHPDH